MRAARYVGVDGDREHRVIVFAVDPVELVAPHLLDVARIDEAVAVRRLLDEQLERLYHHMTGHPGVRFATMNGSLFPRSFNSAFILAGTLALIGAVVSLALARTPIGEVPAPAAAQPRLAG
jgi:hypothetical protein